MQLSKPIFASFCHLAKADRSAFPVPRSTPPRQNHPNLSPFSDFRTFATEFSLRNSSIQTTFVQPNCNDRIQRHDSRLIPRSSPLGPLSTPGDKPTSNVTQLTKLTSFCHPHQTETPRFLGRAPQITRTKSTNFASPCGTPENVDKTPPLARTRAPSSNPPRRTRHRLITHDPHFVLRNQVPSALYFHHFLTRSALPRAKTHVSSSPAGPNPQIEPHRS
jgi:hypothetical protein